MKCPNHSRNEVVGYCTVCAEFGCDECLTKHGDVLYCVKHYRPIAQKIEEEKKHEGIRKRRHKLVVRYLDRRTAYGVCFALNLKEPSFHLDMVDPNGLPTGTSVPVQFSELKALFQVKSFDGNFDKKMRYAEWTPEGEELVIQFKDGEVLNGRALRRYTPNDPRFYLVPSDPESNNLAVLVERAAVEAVYTPDEYKAKLAREREAVKQEGGPSDLTQEETLGDFYFQTKNYVGAYEQYKLAFQKFPQNRRLRKKILATEYNVGVEHIKRREYDKALAIMEHVYRTDPENDRAKKKVSQLRHIIAKGGPADDIGE